jgi:type VI protein secretion system component VasK
MLRFCLVALLALAIPSSPLHAADARKAPKKQERSVEKFLDGTDADRDAMLKDVVKIIEARGYRELAVVPWFVMMAKNAKGREVLLLVDPVSLMAVEIENEPGETAAVPETVVPGLRD